MNAWLKLLTVAVLLTSSACVSAGTRAITDSRTVGEIEVGKSTQADVMALLGCPLTASYGDQGEETWRYASTTIYPGPTAFVLVLKAFTSPLQETTRELTVTFSPDGTVKSLGPPPPPASPSSG